jgi:hypothetical protein
MLRMVFGLIPALLWGGMRINATRARIGVSWMKENERFSKKKRLLI